MGRLPRLRALLGFVAGVLILLSSGAHSILGWKQLQQELAAARVPASLLLGLKVGWLFGGVAMLAFGVITVALFARRLRGVEAPALPAAVIAAAYLGFGGWAFVAGNFSPFFLVFIIPGAMIALAAPGPKGSGESRP